MPVIYSQNFSAGAQQCLQLNANSYARTLAIGTNWTRLRIGMLCNLASPINSALNIRTGSLSMGVCHGIGGDVCVQSPAHCFGRGVTTTPDNVSTGITYNAGPPSYWAMGSGTTYSYFKYENGGVTRSNVDSVNWNLPTNAAPLRRGILILDISKTARVSGTIYMGMNCGAAAHMSLDITSSDLYKVLEQGVATTTLGGLPNIQGTVLDGQPIGYGAGNPLAFNETTYGGLDTVFVFWNMYTIPFNLYELAVFYVG
jgi:hypothetical protein